MKENLAERVRKIVNEVTHSACFYVADKLTNPLRRHIFVTPLLPKLNHLNDAFTVEFVLPCEKID